MMAGYEGIVKQKGEMYTGERKKWKREKTGARDETGDGTKLCKSKCLSLGLSSAKQNRPEQSNNRVRDLTTIDG
jgi:hypothetical protein